MNRRMHSVVVVCVAALSLLATIALLGMFDRRPVSKAIDVGTNERTISKAIADRSNERTIDIELDHLSVSVSRTESFSVHALPQSVRSLYNKRIRIRGYMYPTIVETGIIEFVLNGETQQKGVHGAAPLEHVPVHYHILVALRDGHTAEFSQRPFIVEGVLRIDPQFHEGMLWILFRIDDATITPTDQREGYYASVGWGC